MLKMTAKRRELLANFALNIVVISFGVAAYVKNWWGVFPIIAGFFAFFLLTKEK